MNQEWPPNYLDFIQRQLSQFGRIGSTKILKFPSFGVVTAVTGVTQPKTIRIREPGTVLAMYGSSLEATAASYAGLQFRVQVGGTEYLMTDGQSPAYVSLLGMVGGGQNWFPLLRRAMPGVDWIADFINLGAADSSPELLLAFIADADIARQMPARQ